MIYVCKKEDRGSKVLYPMSGCRSLTGPRYMLSQRGSLMICCASGTNQNWASPCPRWFLTVQMSYFANNNEIIPSHMAQNILSFMTCNFLA